MLWIVGHHVCDGDSRGERPSSSGRREMEWVGEVAELLCNETVCCSRLRLLNFEGSCSIKKGWHFCLRRDKEKLVLAGVSSRWGNQQGVRRPGIEGWWFVGNFREAWRWRVLLLGSKGAQLYNEGDGNRGPLLANDSCGEQKQRWTEGGVERFWTFRFQCPYDWHYKFRHAVDDHNNLHHALPSVEHTITTACWEMHAFSFVLAVTEVNAFLAYRLFCRPYPVPTLQQVCLKLVWELIKNKWLVREDLDKSHVVSTVHQLQRAPLHAMKYANGRWQCNAKQPHQNYPCTFKKCGAKPKHINTYCSCAPGKWICKFCHDAHVVTELKQELWQYPPMDIYNWWLSISSSAGIYGFKFPERFLEISSWDLTLFSLFSL